MSLRIDRPGAVAMVALATGILSLAGGCAAPEHAPDPEPGQLSFWAMPHCVGQQAQPERRAPEHRLAVGPGPAGAGVAAGATAYVETYEHGWGPRAVAEIRTVLGVCGSYEYGDSGDPAAFREQHLVTASGFAGDESLLVETVRLRPPERSRSWCTTVVRSGDVVATVRAARPDPAPRECAVATEAARLATGTAGQA